MVEMVMLDGSSVGAGERVSVDERGGRGGNGRFVAAELDRGGTHSGVVRCMRASRMSCGVMVSDTKGFPSR